MVRCSPTLGSEFFPPWVHGLGFETLEKNISMYEYQVYNFKYLFKKTHNASGGWLDESRVDLKIIDIFKDYYLGTYLHF